MREIFGKGGEGFLEIKRLGSDWGEEIEKWLKQAIFKVFRLFCVHFCTYITGSDSVIRWFESSYPSQGYHILYCEYLWIQYMVF